MRRLLYSILGASCVIISSCSEFDRPLTPVITETGTLKMTVHAGAVGALRKTAAIEMTTLDVQLSSPGLPTVYDKLSLSGGSAERTERQTYVGLASRIADQIVEWTLVVESRDQNGVVIHSGDTTFSIPPLDTIDVEMFLAAQYSMLIANFLPIRDSVERCELKVNGNVVGNLSFPKQTRVGDTITLNYDYLPTSPLGLYHNIELNVYGELWGIDTLLYTGDTTVTVVSGVNDNYQIVLEYVGPDTLHGAATMVVTLGAVGTVMVEGFLNSRITPPVPGTFTDIDGNVYTTVTIGSQTWSIENLRVTKYNDGTPIPNVTDGTEWSNLITPGYCFYDNSTITSDNQKWGALYNKNAVNSGKLAPEGWHVPTEAEWMVLENYLIANGYNWDGTTSGNKIGKSMASQTDWKSTEEPGSIGNDTSKNNTSGFSGLPGGFRTDNGEFHAQSYAGFWWSAGDNGRSYIGVPVLSCYHQYLGRYGEDYGCGFSVRLLRD